MSIGKLLRILERLAPLQSETIKACLQEESSKWEQLSTQSNNLEETKEEMLDQKQVASFYGENTSMLDHPLPLDSIIAMSKSVSEEVEDYRHSDFQSSIAGIIISHNQDFTVVISPTGSGKTWIQGLVAKYFCNKGKKVVIVEPNETLMMQAAEKLALVDYSITVTSIQRLYEEGPWHEVIILDEYDSILQSSPYLVMQQGMRGVWQLRGKKVFAFSATSSPSHERLVNNCIVKPKVLKFKSEFELANGSNPITEAAVVQCETQDALLSQLKLDIEKHYDNHPIVMVLDQDQREGIVRVARENKWKWVDSSSPNYLIEIRSWDYGLLLLNQAEGRGIDTRFKRPSHVMIIAKVQSNHEVQQMIGRSCRTRGVCEGSLYNVGLEKPSQVSERLKRHGIVSL